MLIKIKFTSYFYNVDIYNSFSQIKRNLISFIHVWFFVNVL